MKIAFAAALAGAALLVSPAQAATLIQYNFAGASGSQVSTAATNAAAGVTGLAFTRGAGLTPNAGADSINSSGFNAQATDYYNFGLTVASGLTASVDSLLLGSRSSGSGPGFINLLASLDGGAFSLVGSFAQNGTADLFQTITFGTLTASNSIVFRLVAANQTSASGGTVGSTGTFRVENYVSGGRETPVTINGTVATAAAAVPEPATWAMMLLGFGLVATSMRRRPKVRIRFA